MSDESEWESQENASRDLMKQLEEMKGGGGPLHKLITRQKFYVESLETTTLQATVGPQLMDIRIGGGDQQRPAGYTISTTFYVSPLYETSSPVRELSFEGFHNIRGRDAIEALIPTYVNKNHGRDSSSSLGGPFSPVALPPFYIKRALQVEEIAMRVRKHPGETYNALGFTRDLLPPEER